MLDFALWLEQADMLAAAAATQGRGPARHPGDRRLTEVGTP